MMEDSQRLGAQLKETREKKGLTYEDIYDNVRMHPKMIDDLEAGRFDSYNKIYVKSFLKKYSDFLGLDSEKILEEYKNLTSEVDSPTFGLESSEKKKKEKKKKEKKKKEKKKKPEPPKVKQPNPQLDVILKKMVQDPRVQSAFAAVLAVFLIFLMFTLFRNLPFGRRGEEHRGATETRVSDDREGDARVQDVADKREDIFTLLIAAEETAWLQINAADDSEDTIFVGEIQKGSSRTWEFKEPVRIWTGKGEALRFTLNGQNAGKVADGVVRNIRVSSQKIEVAGETVFSLD